jgi:hypothetical protein
MSSLANLHNKVEEACRIDFKSVGNEGAVDGRRIQFDDRKPPWKASLQSRRPVVHAR